MGTVVLCAGGIYAHCDGDTEVDPRSLIKSALEAAWAIRRYFVHGDAGSTCQIGIHYGPCYGAVMGSTTLTFDVFGDTVNVASRVSHVARSNRLVITQDVQEYVDAFTTDPLPATDIKGKGSMQLFEVTSRNE